ncbi:MAG: ADP-ribosylglycohydrolase family protein [Clostridia bacterium]|nr:ADP-ribosylglycohydrolase family protein [Clostridia bacterium]
MALAENIYKLRERMRLSQEKFAEKLNVSRQAVQKWESGNSRPDLDKLIAMSRLFGVTVDFLVSDGWNRFPEAGGGLTAEPNFAGQHPWESYAAQLDVEYRQCLEEGLEIAEYEPLFSAVGNLKPGKIKSRLADVLYDLVCSLPRREDYPYSEPSDLEGIRSLSEPIGLPAFRESKKALRERIAGGWYGRICGCLLGKPIEGIRTDELIPLLTETGNYPMHRYILKADLTEEMYARCKFSLRNRCFADTVSCAPADDDTNYTVLYQLIVEKFGRDFTPANVAEAWTRYQPKSAYCTAERVAFCNFVKGYCPPDSAVYQNPYREWIGAQIRGDYFGFINPGDPARAAEMAYRDACISHVKNGIYGELFAAALMSCAFVCSTAEEMLRGAMGQIPTTSRLYAELDWVLKQYAEGMTAEACFAEIHRRYDEHDGHDWCHTISNAMIVAAALLYGNGDFGRSICLAVETGFDTDCNGATVGAAVGIWKGVSALSEDWLKPVNGRLNTQILGVGEVSVDSLIEKTVMHIEG